jgi:hypothetical protein
MLMQSSLLIHRASNERCLRDVQGHLSSNNQRATGEHLSGD